MKFYSEVLDKKFDSVEELEQAEKAAAEAAEQKAKKAQERKTEANEVEKLFIARNEAVKKYNKEVIQLRNTYNNAVREARKAFEDQVAIITAEKDKAETDYNRAVNDFINKHPDGYHLTLRDGDSVTTISGSGDGNKALNDLYKDSLAEYDKFMDNVFKGFLYLC